MLASFFVSRPIFAWVIAIDVMALGALSIFTLPVEQYPDFRKRFQFWIGDLWKEKDLRIAQMLGLAA